jgi:hypothetical protein
MDLCVCVCDNDEMNQVEWTTIVRRQSLAFTEANERHDYVAASEAARIVVDACRSVIIQRREQQRRRRRSSWWLGNFTNRREASTEDDQVIEYYLGIAEQMARQYDKCRSAMQVVATTTTTPSSTVMPAPMPRRVNELTDIHQRLEEVAELHTNVGKMVETAGPQVERLNENLEYGTANQRRAEQAIHHYHDRHVTVSQAALPPERAFMTVPIVMFVLVGLGLILARYG